ALKIADRGHVLVNGRNFQSGTGEELLGDENVRRSFLVGAAA
ncbi:MAG: ABC transporter ATP-binding protein, partial [Rhizobiales bacterium]|nr:ABC transporter ATP-binding protein [Hyphomicrobiales bacterium]